MSEQKQPYSQPSELIVDFARIGYPPTGIYVRAKSGVRWGSYDIAELDRASLHTWLRSRGGENLWAENVVLALLGHETESQQNTSEKS